MALQAQKRVILPCAVLLGLTLAGHSATAQPGPNVAPASNAPTASAAEPSSDSDPIQACIAAHTASRNALQQQTLIQVRDELRQCAATGCPIAIRAECGEWLTLAERQVPTLVLSATTGKGDIDTARVFIDGRLVAERLDGHPLEAQPGPHVVVFELSDGRRQELHLVVGIGEKDRVVRAAFAPPQTKTLPDSTSKSTGPTTSGTPLPSSSAKRDLGLVLGLLSIGGAIAAGSLLYVGIDERNSTSNRCAPNCTNSEVNQVRRWFILADIVGIASAFTGGVGLYLFITGDPGRKSPMAAAQWRREF